MSTIKPNKQPCKICKDHKANQPFEIRDDIGRLAKVTHFCNCPYCGRFLSENFQNISTEEVEDE